MKKMSSAVVQAQCAVCKKYSDNGSDVLSFGDWLKNGNLKVHYFCLLLSTYLPQNGVSDSSGILGFLMSDIRKEIAAGAKRPCCMCSQPHATIMCRGCKNTFHLSCGRLTSALFQFDGEFPSYCSDCIPLDDYQRAAIKSPKDSNTRCDICLDAMGPYKPTRWIHAPCCGNGYVHRVCMQKYALEAGYYLRCIWCRGTKFRTLIRMLGIFVPDREAHWETKSGFRDLHRGHRRCDMPVCHNPKGREYISHKWDLILCSLCGSSGAHNPHCIPGAPHKKGPLKEFKCSVCSDIEQRMAEVKDTSASEPYMGDSIKTDLYVLKQTFVGIETSPSLGPSFSEESSISSECSMQTVFGVLPCGDLGANVSKQLEPVTPNSEVIVLSPAIESPNQESTTEEARLDIPIALEKALPEPVGQSAVASDFVTFKAFEFDESWRCVDGNLVRINLKDPRFCGKTFEEIYTSTDPSLLNENDVIERNLDIGVWSQINSIIDEYAD